MRDNIKFDIVDMCSSIDTENEAITIILKDSQSSTSISRIYIPLASLINTNLLNNIKKSGNSVIIIGDLNAKHTDFH